MARTAQKKKSARKKAGGRKPVSKAPKAKSIKPRASTARKATAKPKKAKTPKKPQVKKAPRKIKPRFKPEELSAIRQRLELDLGELREQLAEIEEQAFKSSQSEISGEVGYDADEYADAGSATFEREKDLSIVNNVEDLIEKATGALSKIDAGTYGICESCGNPIEKGRLKALPSVLLCINCKKIEERR